MATTNIKRDMSEKRERSESRDDGDDKKLGRGFSRKKACRPCTDNDYVLDYKDARLIQSYLTEHGKIVPRRITGNCAQCQRILTAHIKRARQLALVGYVSLGN